MFWLGCTLQLGPCLGFCCAKRKDQQKTKQNKINVSLQRGKGCLHPFIMTAVDQCCPWRWLSLALTDIRRSIPGHDMDYWSLKWHSQLMEQFTNQTHEHLVLFGSSRNREIRKCKKFFFLTKTAVTMAHSFWNWVFFFLLFKREFQQQLCGNQIALQPKDRKGTPEVADLFHSRPQSDGTSSEITL